MGDYRVLDVQLWLNRTYGSATGWVGVEEDGITGWGTIYGLRRALQAQLGVSPLASGFGDATKAAFTSRVGRITSATTDSRILMILSSALWVKGIAGLDANYYLERPSGTPEPTPTFAEMEASVTYVRSKLGISVTPEVDVKIMEWLLSMDSCVLLPGGSEAMQEVQRWLNKTYLHRRDFAVVPCDGYYTRQLQKALLFGVQYEIGMADGTANGNFGPGTRTGLQAAQATVRLGSVDTTKNWVRLYQAAMRFNRYDVPFSGSFDATTVTRTATFQNFMELPASVMRGVGGYTTWCNLLVSCGDTSIATTGFDTNTQLVGTRAADAAAVHHFTTVGRYTVGTGKFISADEIQSLRSAGLKVFLIHQRFNNDVSEFTEAKGFDQGLDAAARCRLLGVPPGSTVFFCVDFDAFGTAIDGPVCDFFTGVNTAVKKYLSASYPLEIGVYGARNVCQVVIDRGLASAAFVAGATYGWSANMGYPMPSGWHYNQILETSIPLGGASAGIDKVVVSERARPVDLSQVPTPPVERDGAPSATGYDALFSWMTEAWVAAEVAVEAVLWSQQGRERMSSDEAGDYITQWLREYGDYWPGAPEGAAGAGTVALQTAFAAFAPGASGFNWAMARPAIEECGRPLMASGAAPEHPEQNEYRDPAHLAVAWRGYRRWGTLTADTGRGGDVGIGDLGGWALDLYSVWGEYQRALTTRPGLTVADYVLEAVGSANPFGRADLMADVDSYLIATRTNAGTDFFSAAREVLALPRASRIASFYDVRFGSDPRNVGLAMADIEDMDEVVSAQTTLTTAVWNTVLSHVCKLDDGTPLPGETDLFDMGQAFGLRLAQGFADG